MRIIINLFLFFLFFAHNAQAIELLGITWTGGLSHTIELENYLVSSHP
jgi:hypothetical protein